MTRRPDRPLRTGWTTGACATAAAKSAVHALLRGSFLDPVTITLPKGQTPSFELAETERGEGWARASIIKDAGDDPDVTHLATVQARVQPSEALVFVAGHGVGMVTMPGLPIPPGEPAINPVPRAMIEAALIEIAGHARFEVEISVPGGAELAKQTWNPRLGIEGGISILGTTGIVRPFSCAAWIASIHRGIDVARANGLTHVLAATGSTSETTGRALHDFPDIACLDMGDFAGGLLKYLARHPVERLTLAGGVAKMTKLAQGAVDLHSGRSQVDFAGLASWAEQVGADADAVRAANTALEAHGCGGPALTTLVAHKARDAAKALLKDAPVAVETILIDRAGNILGRAEFA